MSNISKIDKNFKVETTIEQDDIVFYNADDERFEIFGIFKEDGKYRRLPESVAKAVSPGVLGLHAHTAGGRVRFVTDSPYVAINVKMGDVGKMPHFALTGSAGFDIYIDNTFWKSYVPPFDIVDSYESLRELPNGDLREITINFPLYSEVKELYIGVREGSVIKKASPYKNDKPVVYYGSSITQGGCASRPGSSYQAFVSRALNIDYINLGFSGCAKAEDEIIEYIKSLPMSVFVYDYDHNAPTLEHLKKTHEKMFKAVREAQPELPIIMMVRPKHHLMGEEPKRLEVIKNTYENALKNGDKNVYFIDNKALTKLCLADGLVDSNHPTDFGFYSMAEAVISVLKDII